MSRRVVPVTTLVRYIKAQMEKDPVLHGVMIEGEISNMRKPYSGHWYFSLKDEHSSLPCVMFANANRGVDFNPSNGDKVILTGDVSVYESEGRMQMIAHKMQPSGIGDLYQRLEALKKKLSQEGLFDSAHKKPIPRYPEDIALVTGNNTAAREDVLITLKKRWPMAKVNEYPCPVQGMDAAPKIMEALMRADRGGHDVILLVRGGGSLEDLWCFNDENLARLIYRLATPIVTGIGHEIDFTVADYVSDLRANTPTGAVETTVPDQNEILSSLTATKAKLAREMILRLNLEKAKFDRYAHSPVFEKPERLYMQQAMRLVYTEERLMRHRTMVDAKKQELNKLSTAFSQRMHSLTGKTRDRLREAEATIKLKTSMHVEASRSQLKSNDEALRRNIQMKLANAQLQMRSSIKLLNAYSPLAILERGYSIATLNGRALSSIKDVEPNDLIDVRLSDGSFQAIVQMKRRSKE